MKPLIRRRHLLQTGVALSAGLWLPAAKACEFFTPYMRIYSPWARASLKGASSAQLCMTFDEVVSDDRLIGVETPAAGGVELIGVAGSTKVNLLIPQGRDTELTEEGIHILLTDLRFPLHVGREHPLTLIFEKAGVVRADFDIKYDVVSNLPRHVFQ